MNNFKKIFIIFTFCLILSVIFTLSSFALNVGSGYMKGTDGKETNIKWTMASDGLLTFEIDTSATDKVQSTIIPRRDPNDGSIGAWDKCLPTFEGATKVIVGDGITELNGLIFLKNLKQVEIPTSLVTMGAAAFETCIALESIYIRGTEPVIGTFDLSKITKFGDFVFDGCRSASKLILSPDLSGAIPIEFIKGASKITELEIPEGVTKLNNKSLSALSGLKTLVVLGIDTEIASDEVFSGASTYPAIKAKANSKAAEFAKANGYTFIDIDSGETTKGTKPLTGESTGTSSGTTTPGSSTPEAPTSGKFDPEGATLWGHSTRPYNGGLIVDTWWAYYDDTKTLEFVSNTTAYNETGVIGDVDSEYTNWHEYKDVIEHIIVGDNIHKISGGAFQGYSALKDVRIGKTLNQIDPTVFTDCTSLTTIWRNNGERIEGRANLKGIIKIQDAYKNTAFSEIVLSREINELTVALSPSIKTIYAQEITDSLIEYAKANLYNLQSAVDPNILYEYWVYVDPALPSCGGRSVFSFDEATGTLTVQGGGKIDDIVNYYGGGSKNQPWFDIKHSVKHIIIDDKITSIGKYAFCEFSNLETVQIPNSESFEILNATFEKCHKLKSIYRSGNEPIEGTIDIRNVSELHPWTFAYDWLIANIIVSPNISKIGSSTFEENITVNLKGVYGTPGSFAETYAKDNSLDFYDISTNTPEPITCNPPEITSEKDETTSPETNLESTYSETENDNSAGDVSISSGLILTPQDSEKSTNDTTENNNIPWVVIIASSIVIILIVTVIITKLLKKKQK
ncbi:MAG: leucine-rich repeat protein [Clostridia bacterium]|nr:leucine-rich repeat protein [Clostridia bacterium]